MQEREQRLAVLEAEVVTGRAAVEALQTELAATRAAMDEARAKLAAVLHLLETS